MKYEVFGAKKVYKVRTTARITYEHTITAFSAKEAEEIAKDLGESSANDYTSGTKWTAKRIR